MSGPRQGEIWWTESKGNRRPVLIVTRTESAQLMKRVIVAPVTRTIRGIPTEVVLGESSGLEGECVASFDNLQPQRVSMLTERAGAIPSPRDQIRVAIEALTDC